LGGAGIVRQVAAGFELRACGPGASGMENLVDQSAREVAALDIRPDRRQFLGAAAMGIVAASAARLLQIRPASAAENDGIRPFRVDVSKDGLVRGGNARGLSFVASIDLNKAPWRRRCLR
jgi:hypothetical protein